MTTYLAIARLTVGADDRTHRRELLQGMDQLVGEMHDHGFTDAEINDSFQQACLESGVEPE